MILVIVVTGNSSPVSVNSLGINFVVIFLMHFFSSYAAVSDYKQSLQFQNLNDEKRNIHLEV